MAFASVISLKNTIERLLNSSHISIVAPTPEIMEFAYKELKSLQRILKRLDSTSKSSSRKRVNALDGQIREAVCKFEDVLESHVSNQIVSQSESLGGESHRLLFSTDLLDLKQYIHSFTETLKKLKRAYRKVLRNMPEEEEAPSSRIDFGGKKSKMFGLDDLLRETRDKLTTNFVSPVLSIDGMAGIGKTTVAKEIFEDPLILSYFNCRSWVTVGRKYQLNKIARDILAQVDHDTDKMLTEGDWKIAHYLKESLKDKRCLIVLDDVWDTQVWDYLRGPVSNNLNGYQVLLTTRLTKVTVHACPSVLGKSTMRLLNKEESWDLLREKVFGEDQLCPPQLEKAGKKIAEKCDGLPLMFVTVADSLCEADKTPEYWNEVADKKNSSVFMAAYDEISKVLSPSYEYLPQHLKPCFLYMAVFPENYEIPSSKLFKMWLAEGSLEPKIAKTLEHCAKKCLWELENHSLVISCQLGTNLFNETFCTLKTCRLHSSFWHLSNREAGKNKFSHVIDSCADGLDEGIKSQRRLCIHNNILFSIKDVCESMEDGCASTARSLLCFGPHHQYPVPVCFGLRLLRVLDALKIRFYEFPMEVLELLQVRYLALTCNGKLPASISKLWNLQFLIIHRHLSIKSCGAPSYVPMEIWDMQELKHIQIMGSNLPNPNSCGDSLQNLLTILDVSAHSFTKGVIERISNLKKLGIQIELAPFDDSESFHCLNHISRLQRLESLKCVIVNPELRSEIVVPPPPLSMFPSSLQKLHLSGMCYPWEYMGIIGSLPDLRVLKLRCYAFRGPKWEIKDKELFVHLEFLLIEDTDLVQWKVERGSFAVLLYLRMKHCYKLEELHWEFGDYIPMIELVVTCVKNQIKSRGHTDGDISVHSSWEDGNLKSMRLPTWSKGLDKWINKELWRAHILPRFIYLSLLERTSPTKIRFPSTAASEFCSQRNIKQPQCSNFRNSQSKRTT